MPKARARNSKAICFNVTREEYERLQAEFSLAGAHSFADLARAKVMRGVNGDSLTGVARKLDELEQAVQQLSEAIHSTQVETSGASHGR